VLGNGRDNCVAEASQAVHSSGKPINHSTHRGFRRPLSSWTASTKEVPECMTPVVVVCLAELRASPAVGVGHLLAAVVSDGAPCLFFDSP
jgi:hypothetical protein